MNLRQMVACWRRGLRALVVVLTTLGLINLLHAAVDATLPDDAWLEFAVATSLLVLVGPYLAWVVLQLADRSRESRQSLPTVTVATFSDEPSAHIAASVLDRGDMTAVISSGSLGSPCGLVMPAGGIRLRVSKLDRAQAELALAAARKRPVRQ